MNILLLTNKLPYPPNDGGAIASMNMALGLVSAGNKVTILAINTSKHYFPLSDIPNAIASKLDIQALYLDTSINPLQALFNLVFSSLPYNAERFISNDFEIKLSGLLKKSHFDIVQIEGLYMLPYVQAIRENSRAKVVYRAHNIEHEIWKRMVVAEKNMIKKSYLKILSQRIMRFEQKFINTYDALVPITDKDATLFQEIGNTKPVFVTHAGIDFSQLNITGGNLIDYSVFYIGALDWLPNQEGLLWFIRNVWPKVNNTFPQAKFYIAGRNATKNIVKKLEQKNIVYLGEVTDSRSYMLNKMIMVAPLFSGSGMRVKIVEGMSLGKPIVSTTVGAEGLGCSHKKNILIADSVDDFGNAIIQLLMDKNYYQSISKSASAFCFEKFNNLAIIKSLVHFYNNTFFNAD